MTRLPPDCTRFESDLKAYADGELSWLRRQIVRRHLTHCASCQEELLAMTQITEDLRADEPADVLPLALRGKLIASNETERPSETSGSLIIRGRGASSRRLLPAWTFAAVALVAWFVFYPLYQNSRPQAAMTRNLAAMTSPTAPIVSRHPVQIAQSESAASMPEKPIPPPMQADIPEPVPMVAPPSPPKAAYAGETPPMAERAVGQAYDSNGSATPDTLNADPDSLRQVHKEASIGIEVPNPEATGDMLNQMVQETGGYVAANNLTTDPNGLKSGELIVKVPEPQFETFLATVAKLGVVQSKNVTGQDITEKTSDADQTESVLEDDLQQSETRLKALGAKAKWHDQEATRDLRIQLAQERARLVLLKRMAALGTITIDLSQTPKAAASPPGTNGFTGSLKATTHDALQSLVGSASALLALVIWLLAYAPIWVPLLLIGRYALKEYRKRETV